MSKFNLTCGQKASPYSRKQLKISYTTLQDAMNARSELLSRGRNQRPYKCKGCGMYHMTTSGQR